MKHLSIFLIFVFIHYNLKSQTNAAHFKIDIIKINKMDDLSILLKPLTPYKLIMMGEMHGTNEPAAFVTGLAQLFASHGDSVQVGFEIPSDQMSEFTKLKTEKSIYRSDFFSKTSTDGRASMAWAKAIASLNKDPRIHLFFYDLISGEDKFIDKRDSIMYLKIKSNLKAHPKCKTITLSGNIHNMLQPYKGEKKMAAYLRNDSELKLKHKVCALNHSYESGTMLNNIGKGLELREVDLGESYYSKQNGFDNFLFLYKYNPTDIYSGIFYTKKVTAATLANTHGTFTISGKIINAIKKVPVDTSVYVKLLTEIGGVYKAYCTKEGCYSFTFSDSLNGKKIIIRPYQDEKRAKRIINPEACSYSCVVDDLYNPGERVKLLVNTDSVKNYTVNFEVLPMNIEYTIPVFYFKKNGVELVQSDFYLSADSAVCDLTIILQCNKGFAIQINGHCAPQENDIEKLSLKRAILIREKLIALGVNPARISVNGSTDKSYRGKSRFGEYDDPRPAYINKTDYEGQTVTFQIIRRDFKE